MTLPESPPTTVGWNGGRGVESYRLNRDYSAPHSNQNRSATTAEPTRKYLFPPMSTSRRSPPGTSESSSIVTSSSSRNGQDSLLNTSFTHSRTSSEASSSWSNLGLGEKRGSSSSDGLGSMGGRRNTLPPLADLLELGHTELSKKGLPPTPPYSHYSFASSSAASNGTNGKGFAHPPPAPSTGARINNYHHHPHPRPSTTTPTLPLDYSRQRSSTNESVDSNMSNGERTLLPKLERLKISPNSIRNSVISSRSSTMSKGSERDSFYSFASEEGEMDRDREGMDQMMDAPNYQRTASHTPSPTSASASEHGPVIIPSFTSFHQSKNLLSDATLPPILCTGAGLGFNTGLPPRPTRLPSLSAATNSSDGSRPFERTTDFSGLFEGRSFGRGSYEDRSSRHEFVPTREKRKTAS